MDPLEDRMRRTLRDDRWRLPADPEALDRVHEGARRRRRRRTAVNVAAAVAIVAGGSGLAFGVISDRSADQRDVAGPGKGESTMGTPTKRPGSPLSMDPGKRSNPPKTKGPGITTRIGPSSVVPKGFRPASMSGSTSEKFWVLGSADSQPGKAYIVRTTNGGKEFSVTGSVKAPVAPPSKPQSGSITDIRFVDGRNGWAYGKSLWATHDSGKNWKRINAIGGRVERLEAGKGRAYALVETGDGAELWTVRSHSDNWTRANVRLRSPSALAAVGTMVAVTDKTDAETYTMISNDSGASFTERKNACDPSVENSALSATVDALWLKCTTGTAAVLYRSLDEGASWVPVPTEGEALPNSFVLGAMSEVNAVAAVPDETIRVGTGGGVTPVKGLGEPSYVGFTRPAVGYVIGTGGLFRTENGGRSWSEIHVD